MKKIDVSTQEVKVLEKIITKLVDLDPGMLKFVLKIDLNIDEKHLATKFLGKITEKSEKHLVICPSRYYVDLFFSKEKNRLNMPGPFKINSIRDQRKCITYMDQSTSQTLNIKKEYKTVSELSMRDGMSYDKVTIMFGDYRIESKSDMDLLNAAYAIKQQLDLRIDNNIYEDSILVSLSVDGIEICADHMRLE